MCYSLITVGKKKRLADEESVLDRPLLKCVTFPWWEHENRFSTIARSPCPASNHGSRCCRSPLPLTSQRPRAAPHSKEGPPQFLFIPTELACSSKGAIQQTHRDESLAVHLTQRRGGRTKPQQKVSKFKGKGRKEISQIHSNLCCPKAQTYATDTPDRANMDLISNIPRPPLRSDLITAWSGDFNQRIPSPSVPPRHWGTEFTALGCWQTAPVQTSESLSCVTLALCSGGPLKSFLSHERTHMFASPAGRK
ncbi:hypothetical protein Q8A67_023462 [Cirrhinus molitorella]|uniref:Uncharacterized protein n=1 Tax=Cirrhinus molitorella TaxID=172907 RepID=A0AA88TA71_9TELE|nr:hypothetical protein Q8A67_023462 [Cirrhinus molitorella]